MNILIAADYSAPQSGNFIASLVALSRMIRERGNMVIFVFPKWKNWVLWIENEGFQVVCLDIEYNESKSELQVLQSLIQKYEIDLIHCHFGLFHHSIVFNRKELGRVKVVLHDHMDFSVEPNIVRQYFSSVLRSVLYRIKGISVVSVMKRKNSSYWFLKKKWYVPNGLTLERNVEKSISREECRKQLAIKPDEKVVLLLGWDLKRKGLDIALQAIKKCRETNATICLGIIGIGSEPGELTKQFIESETGIDYQEKWIKYFESQEDMFAVHRAIDAYISASRREAFSYGLLEAISQNTPVIVSDIAGTKWASEYTNSFFYPTESVDECSKAILKALECGRCKSNSQEIVDKYGIDRWINEIIKIYDAI